jgi:NAD(P)-dependent dehydrogenase (short-subunit alcohol dehydrogenase family)
MTSTQLTGTTAIVTGASRGFGRAITLALTAHGASVVGVARDETALKELAGKLGPSFTGVAADVTDEALAGRLIADHRPQLLVLNAGATPHPAAVQDHTWESFSVNWDTDVRHAFEFTKAALEAPLRPGSTVISVSSGAARMGSPLSGGYAGAKAMVAFISDYARAESERRSLGIRFVSVLPKLTAATGLGATFVDAYAAYSGIDRQTYLDRQGPALSAEQVGDAVVELTDPVATDAASYLLTADGLKAVG